MRLKIANNIVKQFDSVSANHYSSAPKDIILIDFFIFEVVQMGEGQRRGSSAWKKVFLPILIFASPKFSVNSAFNIC